MRNTLTNYIGITYQIIFGSVAIPMVMAWTIPFETLLDWCPLGAMNLSSFKGSQNHIENLLSASRHSKEEEGRAPVSALLLGWDWGWLPLPTLFKAVEGDVKGLGPAFQRSGAWCNLVEPAAASWPWDAHPPHQTTPPKTPPNTPRRQVPLLFKTSLKWKIKLFRNQWYSTVVH